MKKNGRFIAGLRNGISKYWLIILLLLLSVLPLLPVSPIIQHVPPRDSGFFFYAGSRLLKGDLLYKDVWDDKPPMIFLINALGLWISGGSRWGVWIIELVSIWAAVWMAYSILNKAFSKAAAALGIISGLTILLLTLHGGNYTQEYAIPFQFTCLFFLLRAEQKGGFWPAFACGMAMGILLFLQQSFLSISISISLYLVLRSILSHSWKPFRLVACIGLGALSVIFLFLAIMAIQGIFPGFWDGVIIYGIVYSNLGLMEHLKGLSDALQFFISIPLLVLLIPIWLLALLLLLWHGARTIEKILKNRWTGWTLLACGILSLAAGTGAQFIPGSKRGFGLLQQTAIVIGLGLTILAILQLSKLLPGFAYPILKKSTYSISPASITVIAVAVIWYPIEVVMVNFPDRSFLHYYMAICAICTVLYAFLVDQFQRKLHFWKPGNGNILLASVWVVGLYLTLAHNPINSMRVFFTPGKNNNVWTEAVRYVNVNTKPDDKVLVWGSEPVVNFLSNRSSPVRYTYFYTTFYTEGYGGKTLSAELLNDLEIKKPVLIIYTGDTPFVNITCDHVCTMPSQPLPDGMEDVFKEICSNYYYAGKIGSYSWTIYHINK